MTEHQLRAAAGERVFARGEDYVRYVRGLRVTGGTATASIQARNVYLVELEWSGGQVAGSCTCPHYADGNFCKHQVAVGLASIDEGHGVEEPVDQLDDTIARLVDRMPGDELRDVVRIMAERDDAVRRLIQARAGDRGDLADGLMAMVPDALDIRGFVDYRLSFDVARTAQGALDELEQHLDNGAADAGAPALLRALTRLRKITEQADDSSGAIGDACQRAADLYARACCAGNPDRVKLAKWLVKFRDGSPGWPETPLEDFVGAFDDKAMATYRREVGKLDAKYGDSDQWKRFEIDRMLLELADHEGDVERAVELLSRGEHAQYAGIVDRLTQAGRVQDAVTWMDRGVAAGRVSGHLERNSYWLRPEDVAETYRVLGRIDDAIAVLRGEFARRPGKATFRLLVDFAATQGRGNIEREWALARGRELASAPHATGATLVEIALDEGDLDAAWRGAKAYGAGHMWQDLAGASRDTRPIDAAELYRPRIEQDLQHANSKVYPKIAKMLAAMRDLYQRGGQSDAFAEYLGRIRQDYRRRPSLLAALDRQNLR